MTVSTPLTRALNDLRRDFDADATDPDTQARYEAWARRDGWRVRDEAAALVAGVDPAHWREFVQGSERAAWAEALTLALVHGLDVPVDGLVSPMRVRSWAQAHGIRLPLALSRLLDFMASVLAPAADDASASVQDDVLRAQEREILLGAALMLVTKEQAACLDDEGCYSASRIARLILSRALLWFPLAPPTLDEAAIARLLERWIGRPGR